MSYPDITEAILLEGAPVESFDRTTAALNVVGASTSASRSLLDTNTANYIYVNTSTGNDTTGTGAVGAPYKTLTKAYSVWSSGKVVHVVNSDAITLGSGAETTTSIDRATQAAVGIAPVLRLAAQSFASATRPVATTGDVSGAACNGTAYVVVTVDGKIASSADGSSWTNRTVAANFSAGANNGVVWGADIFLAWDTSGDLSSSSDGTTWANKTKAVGITSAVCGAYGHAGFIVCGATTANLQISTDGGTTWTIPTGIPANSFTINAIIYANGRYFIYGNAGEVIYSDDLTVFTIAVGSNYPSPTGTVYAYKSFQPVAYGNGVFVHCRGSYSYDGFTWQTTGSNFTETTANNDPSCICFGGGYFIAAENGSDGMITADGVTWFSGISGIGTPQYMAFGQAGIILGGDTAENFALIKVGILLKGSLCGFDIATTSLASYQASASIASTNAAVTILNCDADYGIDAVKNSNGFSVKNSVVRNIRASENIPAEISETVVTGNVELFKTYASTRDVNKNTIVGRYSDWDTTTTDIDQFRDNIIEGGISTNRVLTVESGNVRGGYSASVTLTSGAVSAVAPLFIGTGSTPYALRRVADGFPTDSPLLEASTLYDPDGTSGSGRDYGAYSFDATAVSETWTVAFWLPRPTQATFATVPKAYYSPTRSGAINGINRPEGWAEQIAVQWTNLTQEQYANLLLLADEESTRVRLTWNPSLASLTSVTANGAASLGDIVLTVDASAIPVGAIVTIGGEEHRVIKRYPETGNATQLIFNQKLAAAVSDNEVLTVTGSTGYGEYLIKWPDTLGAVPWVSTDQDNYSGLGLAFVRARP